jgi:hypothetical protein
MHVHAYAYLLAVRVRMLELGFSVGVDNRIEVL